MTDEVISQNANDSPQTCSRFRAEIELVLWMGKCDNPHLSGDAIDELLQFDAKADLCLRVELRFGKIDSHKEIIGTFLEMV